MGKLICSDPFTYMRRGLELAYNQWQQSGIPGRFFSNVLELIWLELAKPAALDKMHPDNPEPMRFWSRVSSELKDRCKEHFSLQAQQDNVQAAYITELNTLCRNVFTRQLDMPLRQVASVLGVMPTLDAKVGDLGVWAELELDLLEEDELREVFARMNPGCTEFLLPAFEVKEDNTWTVRGKSMPWPVMLTGRRLCKFAAMLLPFAEFDHFRNAFILPQASRRRDVANILNDVNCDELMPIVDFLTDDDRAEGKIDDPTKQPLVPAIFGAYLDTISNDPGYWLSTVEVVAIAEAYKINVSIVEFAPWGVQTTYTTSPAGNSPCAILRIKNTGNSHVQKIP